MKANLVSCQATLLREIATPELKRNDIAMTYRLAMEADECDRINWLAVNTAIIARWSLAGLQWIKKQAHSGRCFAKATGRAKT